MGYTNFWKQPTEFTQKEWAQVVKEAEYIKTWTLNNKTKTKDYIQVVIEEDLIIIEGVHPNVCENFVLYRNVVNKDRLLFCKTYMRLYDLAVRYLLNVCSTVKKDFTLTHTPI